MTIRSLSAAACVAAALLAGCGDDDDDKASAPKTTTTQSATPTKPTEISGKGYTFTAPAGWAPREQQGLDAILVRPATGARYPTNATVAISPAAGGVTVQQAVPAFIDGLEKQGAKGIVRLPDTELDGESAIALRYERKDRNLTLRQQVVTVIRDGQTYSVGLTALPADFASASQALRQMLQSWSWS